MLERSGAAARRCSTLASPTGDRSRRAGQIDWHALPAVDLAAAALLIRSSWLGNTIRTETICVPAADCGEPIDVTFGIDDLP